MAPDQSLDMIHVFSDIRALMGREHPMEYLREGSASRVHGAVHSEVSLFPMF